MADSSDKGHYDTQVVPFGKSMRDTQFLFAEGHVNLNQGSFGGYPRPVREALRRYQDAAEAEPDRFIRYTYPELLRQSRARLADVLGCPVDELVLCPNVTTATNTVLHNLVWEEGDVIVYTSGVYGALEKTIDYVVESTPARSVKVELDLPRGDDEILDLFKETLRREKERAKRDPKKRDPKIVAVFDTIVSMPGLLMPFERLVRLCREEGVMSLVDAAHGVGQIPLNLSDLDPDFLVTNCHKWLFVPRSVAAFYVARRNQHLIRTTLPTSHGFRSAQKEGAYDPMPASSETNDFVRQFEYFGTIDGAPYCCIEGALDFRDRVCGGEAAIRTYCTDLARRAERILVDRLGTESFNIPETHRVFFAHVRLPITVGDANSGCDVPKGDVDTVTQFMNKEFVDTYRTFLYLLFYRGAWWARLSATVYVDIRDCEYAARVLEDLSEMVRKGAYRAADPASRK